MRSRWVRDVIKFHKAFGHPIGKKGREPSNKERVLRLFLLSEEFGEYCDALTNHDRVEILDALADMIFVCIGTAVCYGFDIDKAMRRVVKSNMSKLGKDGKPIYRADGKVAKGENFIPPYFDDLV